jgi:hypothetical protein
MYIIIGAGGAGLLLIIAVVIIVIVVVKKRRDRSGWSSMISLESASRQVRNFQRTFKNPFLSSCWHSVDIELLIRLEITNFELKLFQFLNSQTAFR